MRRHGVCAFVPEKVALAPALRCGEWLSAMRGLRGLAPTDWGAALAAGGLDPALLDRPAAALSKGMLQRLALVEAIQSGCPLLLLDEPFAGPDGRRLERTVPPGASDAVLRALLADGWHVEEVRR